MEPYRYRTFLSKYSKGQFNYYFAKIVGINAAVYFEELQTQFFALSSEDKNWFMPKYSEIQKLLNFSKEEQDEFIGAFISLGIVEKNDKLIKLNLDSYIRMLLDDSQESLATYQVKASEGVHKIASRKDKKLKGIKENLKSQVLGNDVELRQLYFMWIDAIVDRFEAIPNQTVILGQQLASNFAQGNRDVEKAVLEKAIINVYRDMSWAINAFKNTMTIEGNMASTKPVTLTQPVDIPSSEENNNDYEVTFGGVV